MDRSSECLIHIADVSHNVKIKGSKRGKNVGEKAGEDKEREYAQTQKEKLCYVFKQLSLDTRQQLVYSLRK